MIPFTKKKNDARVDGFFFFKNFVYCPPSVIPSLLHLKSEYTYTSKLGTVTFYSNEDCDKYADVVATIWGVLLPYRNCPAPIQAIVLMGDSVKQLDGVLGQGNVNTGYAIRCSRIVVYRKEEWVKVFIHECMHELNLDKGMSEVRLPMFGFSHFVALNEAFCEAWARILNCYVVASYTNKSVMVLLETERIYSVYNMVKVLRHSGMQYSDLWTDRAGRYTEHTHVVAYVVLAAILMNDYAAFHVVFRGLQGTNDKLLHFIQLQYKSDLFLHEVGKQETDYKNTTSLMRMSIVDLF